MTEGEESFYPNTLDNILGLKEWIWDISVVMTYIACLTATSYIRDLWQLSASWVTAPISSEHSRLILVELLLHGGVQLWPQKVHKYNWGLRWGRWGTIGWIAMRVLGNLSNDVWWLRVFAVFSTEVPFCALHVFLRWPSNHIVLLRIRHDFESESCYLC